MTTSSASNRALSRIARRARLSRGGLSMLEMLAVVTILGILAAVVVAGFSAADSDARVQACYVNKGNIELQARLWFRNYGTWPATDLSNIGADSGYFPDGLPTCPVDQNGYTLDAATHNVVGHVH